MSRFEFRKSVERLLVVSFACCHVGCAAELGGQLGRGSQTAAPWDSQGEFVSAAHVGVHTILGTVHGPWVGAEVEGRAAENRGSRWLTGLQVGYGWNARRTPGSLGPEIHLDFGTPLRRGALFPNLDYYAGATAGVAIFMGPKHEAEDLNDSTWVLIRAFELVPYLRYRMHSSHFENVPSAQLENEWGVGISLRMRVVSDYL